MTLNVWTDLPDPTEAAAEAAPPAQYRTLFDITRKDGDRDTLLVPRAERLPDASALRDAALEEAATICDRVAVAYGGVATGKFATEYGKQIHQAMANGAHNAGSEIRAALSTAPKPASPDLSDFIEIG